MSAQVEQQAHALLAASAAHRWLECTPSARLEATLPEASSTYADEGRLAHEIAALKLRKHFVEPMDQRAFNSRLKKLQADPLYQPEMLTHTDTYLDYASKIAIACESKPYVAVEVRVSFDRYVPDGFGTADNIIISGTTLYVTDFKYGKGVPVSAEQNPQMMLYALGALAKYGILYDITVVKMAIVQPRLDTISERSIAAAELREWGETYVKPRAQLAFNGEGEFSAGDHCRFCRAKATCRARADYYLALDGFKKMMPPLISNEEVGDILVTAQGLAAWLSDLEAYALTECLNGNKIPGWKAVEGRAVRQWTDGDAAFTALKVGGVDEAMLYERKPLTLAAVEKLLGKTRFMELASEFVNTPPGRPALAPVSDKRPAITRQTAADDFGNTKGETENGS